MNFEAIIVKYGYFAIIMGTFLEGETILVIGGFLAHIGLLSLPLVILSAFIGSFSGDQLYFLIGRFKGAAFIDKRPNLMAKAEKFRRLLDKHHTPVILIFRFLYGLRTVAPFAIGLSGIAVSRFVFLNFISALIWAVAVACLGYFFGRGLETLFENMRKYEIWLLAGVITIIAANLLFRIWKIKKNSQARS
jgi:membrane protein DedA with SNARE-associated domain